MKKIILLLLFSVCTTQAQTTIGLLHHNASVSDGYTLFGYKQGNDVYLINNCGEVVNQWSCNQRLGVAYILDNGNLLKSGENYLELRDWDNNLLWEVDLSTQGLTQHHDIEPLPNGNILVLSRDTYTSAEAIAQGRDPLLVGTNLTSEKIVEIEPVGTNNFNIVWEWKIWDHLIQDFDNTKPNFGVVANHPELLDLNLGTASGNWIHANAVEYNADLDQIVYSSRKMDEIYIIDHSTTTAEAASHAGGSSGKGGDFLWRWGNPENYGQGTSADKKLYGQHDPKWIPSGYPNAGKLSLFNNGTGRTPSFSSVHIIDTQVDINGDYSISGSFMPTDFFWSWDGMVLGTTVFSNSQSGANIQPNGNVLFCETVPGRISEIDSSGNLMWSYENPIGSSAYVQGNVIPDGQNQVFRAEKYPVNFIGFSGKDLSSTGIIENVNIVSNTCITLSVEDNLYSKVKSFPNPVISKLNFSSQLIIESVELFDLLGEKVAKVSDLDYGMDFTSYKSGVYILKIYTNKGTVVKRIIKQ